MSVVAIDPHGGPWTEDDYFALGESNERIELIDGSLYMTPAASSKHQRCSFMLTSILLTAAPLGFDVIEAVNLRLGRDRILIPDIVVTTRLDDEVKFFDAADIALVVEIASPSNATTDRVLKSHLYAAAGIETYLRVELGEHGPVLYLYRLRGTAYALVAEGGTGNPPNYGEPYHGTSVKREPINRALREVAEHRIAETDYLEGWIIDVGERLARTDWRPVWSR